MPLESWLMLRVIFEQVAGSDARVPPAAAQVPRQPLRGVAAPRRRQGAFTAAGVGGGAAPAGWRPVAHLPGLASRSQGVLVYNTASAGTNIKLSATDL